ncbi:tRNA uridine-5-carboxymethylaminomethyl(34) synthesis GTPase MnmE [Pinirhizobacter sp.]|jgi:tRNA modification GTPase|uniref:tRNA uridine-5-carboxymethylaminomethyl(34) synthesis GTPase MnmE n=1 Tax=Pinirhizobacter sp. TaxID=2950432 RepID=UPI002F3F2B93
MDHDNDTIAAIATAAGAAGVGVVRVSGPLAPAIARSLLGRMPRARHAHLTVFGDAKGETIDHGLLLYFPGPASYTGEDVLELQGHGSMVLLDELLRHVCTLGARLARAGEFTERAFLNGKLDLAQAEAVADLISARSRAGAHAAMRSMEGVFSRKVDALQDELINLRVHVEAAIDFPEEEIDFLADPAIARQLDDLRASLDDLLVETRRGVRLNDGLSVAIVGRPNVGKSSLLNALAGRARAIVTDIAGTTRDIVHELVTLDGMVIELADTAGLRDTEDLVEREGVRRANDALRKADVALLVTTASCVEEDLPLLGDVPEDVIRLVVLNKVDVEPSASDPIGRLSLSALTGEGVDMLRARLRDLAGVRQGDGSFSARRRHVLALEATASHLVYANVALIARAGELAAESLRAAQGSLGEITGTYTADDLLGSIFGSFCIGK